MHPVILKLGPVAIHGYGLMLAVSFLVGIYLAARRAKKAGIDPEQIMNLSLYIIVSSVVGARLFYVIFHWEEYAGNLWALVSPIQEGRVVGIFGLVLYGGVILATLVGMAYILRRRLPLWRVADVVAPSIALGVFFTRLGCFLNGCCFGVPSDSPWAVVFPLASPAGSTFPGLPLHPTQLYSSLYGLAIFGMLLGLERFKRFDGFTFWLFIMLYALARFLVDFVRYYEPSMTVLGGLSVNQAISIVLFAMGGAVLVTLWQKQRTKGSEGSTEPSLCPPRTEQ